MEDISHMTRNTAPTAPTIDTVYADYLLGIATAHLPAAERLATSHRYRAMGKAQRARGYCYLQGRCQLGSALLTPEQLVWVALPKSCKVRP